MLTFIESGGSHISKVVQGLVHLLLVLQDKGLDETMVDELGAIGGDWGHAPTKEQHLHVQ